MRRDWSYTEAEWYRVIMNANEYMGDKGTALLHTKNLHCNYGFYTLIDGSLSSFLNSFWQNSMYYTSVYG